MSSSIRSKENENKFSNKKIDRKKGALETKKWHFFFSKTKVGMSSEIGLGIGVRFVASRLTKQTRIQQHNKLAQTKDHEAPLRHLQFYTQANKLLERASRTDRRRKR